MADYKPSLIREILKLAAGILVCCLIDFAIIGLPLILAYGIKGDIPLWIGIASYVTAAIVVCIVLGCIEYRQQKWLQIPYEERKKIIYSRIS